MNETTPPDSPKPMTPPKAVSPPNADAITPDELMSDFRGHSLVKILIFTVVVHVVLLAVFSPGYIKTQVFGESEDEPTEEVAELTDEQKLEKAQKDGKAALREVANKYGLTVKQLNEQLASEKAATPAVDPAATDSGESDSQIERDLTVEIDGPDEPDLSADDEEDLFAPQSP